MTSRRDVFDVVTLELVMARQSLAEVRCLRTDEQVVLVDDLFFCKEPVLKIHQ